MTFRYYQKAAGTTARVLAVPATGLGGDLTFNLTGLDYIVDDPSANENNPRVQLAGAASRPGFFEGQSLLLVSGTGLVSSQRRTVIRIDGADLYIDAAFTESTPGVPIVQPTDCVVDFDTYGTTPNSRGFIGNYHVPKGNSKAGQGGSSDKGVVRIETGIKVWGYYVTAAGASGGDVDIYPLNRRSGVASSLVIDNGPALSLTIDGNGAGWYDFGGVDVYVREAATPLSGEKKFCGFALQISAVDIIGHLVFSFMR